MTEKETKYLNALYEQLRDHRSDIRQELKDLNIKLDRIEKIQKDRFLFLFFSATLLVVILVNNGMMGQLWDFNFSEFLKFQFIWSD